MLKSALHQPLEVISKIYQGYAQIFVVAGFSLHFDYGYFCKSHYLQSSFLNPEYYSGFFLRDNWDVLAACFV
jgi:hypothetical protein